MKKHISAITGLIIFLGLVLNFSCGGDDTPPDPEPTAQEIALEKLTATWNISGGSIVLDGRDVSANYNGLSISYTATGYSTTNAGDLFSASGTWEWVGDTDNQILLDDGKQITITTLNDTDFVFNFQLNGSGGGVAGVEGSYIISLKK